MTTAAYEECPQAEFTAVAVEYGTLPQRDVIDALRADQWLENPDADDAIRRDIKREVRDAFYTDTDEWKRRIVEQGVGAANDAVRGLTSGRARAGARREGLSGEDASG